MVSIMQNIRLVRKPPSLSPSPLPLFGALTGLLPSGLSAGPGETQQAVRFASVNQEIEPEHSLQPYDTAESSERPNTQVLSQATQAELERLSTTLQNVHLQQRRLSNFAFEPVSLPVSRVSGHLPYRAANIYGIMYRCYSFVPTQVLSTSHRKKVQAPVWTQCFLS